MKYGIIKHSSRSWHCNEIVVRIWEEDGYTWVQECAVFENEDQGKGRGLEDAKTFISMKRSAEALER